MFRGYRRIILAACWLALSAQAPKTVAAPQQQTPDARVGDALQNIASTYRDEAERAHGSPESQPCERGDDHRDSDLCAQWKAADAAEKAAWWAAFAGWFGGLSFLGVLAAIGVAFQSNRIARDTAKKQLRAYVGVVGVWLEEDDSAGRLLFRNFGQTPATNVSAKTFTTVAARQPGEAPHDLGIIDPAQKRIGRFAISPSILSRVTDARGHTDDTIIHPANVKVVIKYTDIGGDRWRRCQVFEVAKGEPLIIGDSGHIVDFSLSHGQSSEEKISKSWWQFWKKVDETW